MSNTDFVVVTAMKNEGPYILEWVAHHLSIGFGHFIVVTNDCDDGTDQILLELQRKGLVTHAVNPRVLTEDVGKWQIAALKFAQYYPAYRQAKWILHSDVDEFVHLESPLTQISDLVQQLAPVDAISLTSCPYSGDNRVELRDEPVCDQFGMMSRVPAPDTFTAVKTLYRNALPWSPRRNHRPIMRDFSARGLVWKDGSGHELPPVFTDTDKKAIASGGTINLAHLNHYAIRSIESFLVKIDRGDVMDAARLENRFLDYYRRYDQIGIAAPSPLGSDARLILADFMKDLKLSDLHRAAFAWHRNRAEEILKTGKGFATALALGLGKKEEPARAVAPEDDQRLFGTLHAKANSSLPCDRDTLPHISSFWTGSDLSFVEVLAAQSFLDAGHRFTLYTLDEVANVPKGVEIKNARDILAPRFEVGHGLAHNNAVYSDIFRLRMIQETGAIWADMDAYCLRRFVFPCEYVFGNASRPKKGFSIENGILGLPKDSPCLTSMLDFLLSDQPIPPFFNGPRRKALAERAQQSETWGVESFKYMTTGPRTLDHFVRAYELEVYAMPSTVFYPGPSISSMAILDPSVPDSVYELEETRSVHIYGKTKAQLVEHFDGVLPRDCYLDRLCRRHGIDPAEFPIGARKTTGTVAKGKVGATTAE